MTKRTFIAACLQQALSRIVFALLLSLVATTKLTVLDNGVA
jgi:hypothetical protein